jgi:photosystem I subunit 4
MNDFPSEDVEGVESSAEENQNSEPTASGGKQTPIDPAIRRTGQGTHMDVREGAAPEAPGTDNPQTEGDPNQGTESR